jgi:hypothetical protein
MNKKTTIWLTDDQVNYLNLYAKERSITFSSALREHISIASREIKNFKENEQYKDKLKGLEAAISLEGAIKELSRTVESLKDTFITFRC